MAVVELRLSWATKVDGLVCRCHGTAYSNEWESGDDHDDDPNWFVRDDRFWGATLEQPLMLVEGIRGLDVVTLGPWKQV